MISFGHIFLNTFLESLDSVLNFSRVFGNCVGKNIEHEQVLGVFIPFDDTVLDDWFFLHSRAEEQVLLSEQLHDEKSIVGDRFCVDVVHVAVLATIFLGPERSAAVEVALGQQLDEGQHVPDLIGGIAACFGHELAVEPNGPGIIVENVAGLVNVGLIAHCVQVYV